MIKRTSLVWKRPELSDADFKSLWLGEHAETAKGLAGVREYVIDFVENAAPELPSGIAVLRFDNRAALEAAFADEELRTRLFETRDAFAARVEVFLVEEAVIIKSGE